MGNGSERLARQKTSSSSSPRRTAPKERKTFDQKSVRAAVSDAPPTLMPKSTIITLTVTALLLSTFLASRVYDLPALGKKYLFPTESETHVMISPAIHLKNATFVGSSMGIVHTFLGIPFAEPPVGDLRFQLPVSIKEYTGTHNASTSGPSCPQLAPIITVPEGLSPYAAGYTSMIHAADFESEDCLTLDIVKPAQIDPDTKLPVLVWFFGGGFQFGGAGKTNGIPVVMQSINNEEPVIFVVMNYRLNALGFLASKEVKDAGLGNLGLQDQREALRWIQKHISAFGGDPEKVTIWGQSAGAISVSLQLVANEGDNEGLFWGAIMQSGAPLPVGDITNGQVYYDDLVLRTSCVHAEDTLECLRQTPYNVIKAAIDTSPGIFDYQSMMLSWLPRTDGKFITELPLNLVKQGKVANVPFISGNVNDEATLFTLPLTGIKTDAEFRKYINRFLIYGAEPEELDEAMNLYPADPSQGSPYGTGEANQVSPQWKRLASIQGDLVFQSPRRFLVKQLSGRQNIWSYLNRQFEGFPDLGTPHSSDLVDIFSGEGVMTDYFLHFANTLDPNGSISPRAQLAWPKYSTESEDLLTFLPNRGPDAPLVGLEKDTYRQEGLAWLETKAAKYQL